MYPTVHPDNVPEEMKKLLDWYSSQSISIETLAEFHAKYESIHPFQDGNGRNGRLLIYRECLKHHIIPLIIRYDNKMKYLAVLKSYRERKSLDDLITLFKIEQSFYYDTCCYFI